jgi:hypothetical protein
VCRYLGVQPLTILGTICRLNSIEYLRCVAMGILLESPVQIVRFSHPDLSTRRGALQILVNSSPPFDIIGRLRALS